MNGVFVDSNVFLKILEGNFRVKNKLKKAEALINIAKNLPINDFVEEEASKIVQRYGLLPNDALIAATCKHQRINKIATFDHDFKRVDFLEIITPE
ncbi:MAG: PIN domain-containing protein [Halobacteriota archaeon]